MNAGLPLPCPQHVRDLLPAIPSHISPLALCQHASHLPQRSQGSQLGEQRCSALQTQSRAPGRVQQAEHRSHSLQLALPRENSPKLNAGRPATQGRQRGLRRTSTLCQPSARQLLPARIKARKGENPGGTGHATEDAQGHQLALRAVRIGTIPTVPDTGQGQESPASCLQHDLVLRLQKNTEVGC